jgi:hypothetical protein
METPLSLSGQSQRLVLKNNGALQVYYWREQTHRGDQAKCYARKYEPSNPAEIKCRPGESISR